MDIPLLRGILSIFLQDLCPLCDRSAKHQLCPYCQRQLQAYRLSQPDRLWTAQPPLLVWGYYDGKLKQAIATMKYEHHPQLGLYLGQYLAEAWLSSVAPTLQQSPLVVPIPLHPRRHQERGFNQAALIAQGFCQKTGYPLQVQDIQRIRDTTALFSLSPSARQQELHQAFSLGSLAKQRPSRPILLIDDIYTTGSTTREVMALLHQYHFPCLGIVAIATPKTDLNTRFKADSAK